MGKKKINLWILHAGLGHPSPYFYNLCKELKKHKNIKVLINANLPVNNKAKNGIVYFNRLKRFYNSEDIN